MNRILLVCLFVLALMALASMVGVENAAAAPDAAAFAGTWKGTMNDLAGIDLTIKVKDKEIKGSVIFYFQKRADVSSPWLATADPALPLLKPHIIAIAHGTVLTFEVEHHVCHGCRELGPNRPFRMELLGANEARLTALEDDGTEAGPQLKLVRTIGASADALPQLQPGVSVEMPVTSSARPAPEADQPDAMVLTVTIEGNMYLGVNPIDHDRLIARLREIKNAGTKLYIKADSRASYAKVIDALDAASTAGIETTVLLTSQHSSPGPGAIVPPAGMIVDIGGSHFVARGKLSL